MRIGVFTALWGNLSFEAALDKAAAAGVTAVEIGAGGYPGSPHCPVDDVAGQRAGAHGVSGRDPSPRADAERVEHPRQPGAS